MRRITLLRSNLLLFTFLSAAAALAGADILQQQAKFDKFIEEFNRERPP